MKKIYEREMPLLKRKRVAFEVEHPKKPTPKREELIKQLSSTLKIKPELISIRHVYTKFGSSKVKVICNVYDDEKTLKLFDPPRKKELEAMKKAEEEKKAAEVKKEGNE